MVVGFFFQIIIEFSIFFSSAKDNLASTAHVSAFVCSLPARVLVVYLVSLDHRGLLARM